MFFRKKTRYGRARKRFKKRWWLFDKRSLPERAVDAVKEYIRD